LPQLPCILATGLQQQVVEGGLVVIYDEYDELEAVDALAHLVGHVDERSFAGFDVGHRTRTQEHRKSQLQIQ